MIKVQTRRRALALALGLAVAAVAGAQQQPPATQATKTTKKAPAKRQFVVEPRALELIKAASARLAAAQTMSFTATVSYEHPSRYGPPVVTTTRYDVTLQRPDKLRVVSPGDGPPSEFYYDGKAMAVYLPAADLAAVVAAPPTIGAALDAAFRAADIYFPFEDLLLDDPYAALAKGALLAFELGPSGIVGGVKTDSVVWANKDVFLQMWIGVEDKLPRRFRAIYAADPKQLRYDMELTNWQLGAPVAPTSFASDKVQTAKKIDFAKPKLPKSPPIKPLAKPAAPAAKPQ
ncbi:MAG: DUF2092 domain-containing protein [Betaproteobacteria bacterium]